MINYDAKSRLQIAYNVYHGRHLSLACYYANVISTKHKVQLRLMGMPFGHIGQFESLA